MEILEYNRQAAYDYARKWAFGRNPKYYDFSRIGGDCTNFASQCIYAGAGVMNFTPTFGWFYKSADDRTPSWTGVEYLYNFLVNNKEAGPFAEEVPLNKLEVGDIVQLGRRIARPHTRCGALLRRVQQTAFVIRVRAGAGDSHSRRKAIISAARCWGRRFFILPIPELSWGRKSNTFRT